MRSRYTAYAIGAVGHILRTTAPESPHRRADARAWQAEIEAWCASTRFLGLEVLEATESGDEGRVRFVARLATGDRDASFGEHSRFVRRDGRWLYVDGSPVSPRQAPPAPAASARVHRS